MIWDWMLWGAALNMMLSAALCTEKAAQVFGKVSSFGAWLRVLGMALIVSLLSALFTGAFLGAFLWLLTWPVRVLVEWWS